MNIYGVKFERYVGDGQSWLEPTAHKTHEKAVTWIQHYLRVINIPEHQQVVKYEDQYGNINKYVVMDTNTGSIVESISVVSIDMAELIRELQEYLK